jgi:hypothetical protein
MPFGTDQGWRARGVKLSVVSTDKLSAPQLGVSKLLLWRMWGPQIPVKVPVPGQIVGANRLHNQLSTMEGQVLFALTESLHDNQPPQPLGQLRGA